MTEQDDTHISKVRIERTSDWHDCVSCGSSHAGGANIYRDGILLSALRPVAHCYFGVHWDEDAIMAEVLRLLGYYGGYDDS
jgi:hypothetical protein